MSDERTLDPTDQRREQFRKEGRFARARDAGGVAATVAVIGLLAGSGARISSAARVLFAQTLGDLGALQRFGPSALEPAATGLFDFAGPPVFAAALAATIAGLAQAGFRPYPEMLGLKLERLDPSGAIGKLLSPKRAGQETAVAVLRVVLVGWAAWRSLLLELPNLLNLARMPLDSSIGTASAALGRVLAVTIGALVLIALVDYGQSWLTTNREMKMTEKERKDESRQQDGDLKAKARMKQRSRALAKKRALSNVKNADVVVTNPTHVAVALRYGPKDPAPIVIAKGHDDVALTIRGEARKWGIPILENRPLARALDAEVQIGRPVPPAHFAAVARVLAFVYRLRGKSVRGTRRA
jgi:flagellar biosynthetic protein FlhB